MAAIMIRNILVLLALLNARGLLIKTRRFQFTILETLQEVQLDLKSINVRVSSMENYGQQSMPAFPPIPSVKSDALSVLAFSDVDLVYDEESSNAANEPSTQASEPPTRDNEPPLGIFGPQTKAVKPCNEAGNQNTKAIVSPNGVDYNDSD